MKKKFEYNRLTGLIRILVTEFRRNQGIAMSRILIARAVSLAGFTLVAFNKWHKNEIKYLIGKYLSAYYYRVVARHRYPWRQPHGASVAPLFRLCLANMHSCRVRYTHRHPRVDLKRDIGRASSTFRSFALFFFPRSYNRSTVCHRFVAPQRYSG